MNTTKRADLYRNIQWAFFSVQEDNLKYNILDHRHVSFATYGLLIDLEKSLIDDSLIHDPEERVVLECLKKHIAIIHSVEDTNWPAFVRELGWPTNWDTIGVLTETPAVDILEITSAVLVTEPILELVVETPIIEPTIEPVVETPVFASPEPVAEMVGPVTPAKKLINHGTLNAYQSYKCRCSICRQANAIAKRVYVAKKKEQAKTREANLQSRNLEV
jgi:hypothetical protein